MKNIIFLISLLAAGASSLLASSTYVFLDPRAGNQNSETFNGNTYDISPYAGSLGSNKNGDAGNTAVQLFCDDFPDESTYGTGWQVNVTSVTSADLSNTRYGSANANSSFPTGTTLYEEMAWLFTQDEKPGQTIANQDAIGEAVWHMTDPTGTPTTTSTATSPNMTYLQWISAAQADYKSTVAGYLTPNYNNWMIIDDPAAKGNTGGKGIQEFLSYYTQGGVPVTSTTPEPGSFFLLGTSLILGGVFGLRGLAKRSK